jgi:phytoene dehydrogenase-like protein
MPREKKDFDAIVIGSGPNGLAAAILMQQKGLSVLLLEGKSEVGGGLRSAELTLPGFKHDICSAIHPLAAASPFFKTLPLAGHGLSYVYPEIDAAHPLEHANSAFLCRSIDKTAQHLGVDEKAYLKLMGPVTKNWPLIDTDVLGPLHFPKHPLALASFGLDAMKPVTLLAKGFKTKQAKALLAGMAAHAIQPLTNMATSAIALVLMAAGHLQGWPVPVGGSNSIANALASYFVSLGGKIETDTYVKSLDQLPSAHALLFDVTPKQLLQIAGHKFSSVYKWQLERYRYGMGVYKIDWALDEAIPFTSEGCRKAGTVHLGNTLNEIRDAEQQTWNGKHPDKPFVLLAQQSLFDSTRAPKGKHTAWAYCHVPNGSKRNMTNAIEKQVERYAPGFRDIILARHTMNAMEMEEYNPNYIGGDINGGVIDLGQLFTRPALRYSPYKTSEKGMYICSSSTPPGGGVHGMCGYYAAKKALKDVFDITDNSLQRK